MSLRPLLALLAACALLAVTPAPSARADVIDDEPEPGLPTTPTRRPPPPGEAPPPPPPPPPARPAPPPPPMAAPAPPPPAPVEPEDLFRMELALWLWMPRADGDSQVRGNPIDIDLDWDDVFEDFDSKGVAGRFEVWRRNLGVFVESGWLEHDGRGFATLQPAGPELSAMDIDQIKVDFGLSYEVFARDLGNGGRLAFQPIVGGRWNQIEQTARFAGGSRAQDRHSYWEPFVGGRIVWDITDRFGVRVGGDAGGFDVGSDLTWNLLGELGYKVTQNVELRLGYGVQDIDYSTDSRSRRFELDTRAHGPRFGLALHF